MLDNEDSESAHVEEIKLAAINLLLDGLELPAPTLTHFLLGFNLQVSQFHEFFSVKLNFVYYYYLPQNLEFIFKFLHYIQFTERNRQIYIATSRRFRSCKIAISRNFKPFKAQ